MRARSPYDVRGNAAVQSRILLLSHPDLQKAPAYVSKNLQHRQMHIFTWQANRMLAYLPYMLHKFTPVRFVPLSKYHLLFITLVSGEKWLLVLSTTTLYFFISGPISAILFLINFLLLFNPPIKY